MELHHVGLSRITLCVLDMQAVYCISVPGARAGSTCFRRTTTQQGDWCIERSHRAAAHLFYDTDGLETPYGLAGVQRDALCRRASTACETHRCALWPFVSSGCCRTIKACTVEELWQRVAQPCHGKRLQECRASLGANYRIHRLGVFPSFLSSAVRQRTADGRFDYSST